MTKASAAVPRGGRARRVFASAKSELVKPGTVDPGAPHGPALIRREKLKKSFRIRPLHAEESLRGRGAFAFFLARDLRDIHVYYPDAGQDPLEMPAYELARFVAVRRDNNAVFAQPFQVRAFFTVVEYAEAVRRHDLRVKQGRQLYLIVSALYYNGQRYSELHMLHTSWVSVPQASDDVVFSFLSAS